MGHFPIFNKFLETAKHLDDEVNDAEWTIIAKKTQLYEYIRMLEIILTQIRQCERGPKPGNTKRIDRSEF